MVSDPGESIQAVDLDESANRLALYGSDSEAATVAAIKDHASGLGVPAEAISVKQVGADLEPPTPDPVPGARRSSDATEQAVPIGAQRVNRALNPFVGGAEIKGGGVACTATMTVAFVNEDGDDESGFITGDHCGVVSTTWRAYGTGSTGDRKVGVTARTAKGGNRNIDIAYANWDSPEGVELGVGFIARPVEENTAKKGATKTQLSLDPDHPYFEVAGIRRPVSGEVVHKVGRSSGWTSGKIRGTCVAQVFIGDPAQSVCSADWFSMHIMAGDSGSPVFAIEADGRVSILNIVSGYSIGHRFEPAFVVMFHSQGIDEVRVTPNDYDADDDGLIEVSDLAQLNAIRWDLDGDGSSGNSAHAQAFPLAKSDMGCAVSGCRGYELAADLDFDTDGDGAVDSDDDHWNDGKGWLPIGDNTSYFYANFDGNGHTITNLNINRPDQSSVGLFNYGLGANFQNLNLQSVNVTAQDNVGALVGIIYQGYIARIHVSGTVAGNEHAGAIAGANSFGSSITESYSSATVKAERKAGGLVGLNWAKITAAYATGDVTAGNTAGGLVGFNERTVSAAYSTGRIDADSGAGGLVGANTGTVTDSYWDTETSNQSNSAAGNGQTTDQLASPTGYTGIYVNWKPDLDQDSRADDPWYFGTSSQYPTLKAFKVPAAPSSVIATPSNASVVLSWSTANDQAGVITGHQYQSDGGAWIDIPGSAYRESNSTSWIVTGLNNGTTYTFRLRAVNIVLRGPASAAVTVSPRTTPGPPNINRLNGTLGGIAVSWSPPADNGGSEVTGYDLRYILVNDDETVDSNWTQVDGVWTSGDLTYTVSGLTEGWQYEAQVRAVNAAGEGPWSAPAKDRDADDDGLIEISNLSQLHAFRWDLDGDGVIEDPAYAREFSGRGCPEATGCTGYELIANLDFDTDGSGSVGEGDDYWNEGAGWEPIGFGRNAAGDKSDGYTAIFDGNGHVISHLFIDRPNRRDIAMFESTEASAVVTRIGLTSVNVTGQQSVAALSASNEGVIRASYATGTVSGSLTDTGGLVGGNSGNIYSVFFAGEVSGNVHAGGLVGGNSGTVTASYSSGGVEGNVGVGGVSGINIGSLQYVYAIGEVMSPSTVGGLVGDNFFFGNFGVAAHSYWDTDSSAQSHSAGGTGKTTGELQTPNGYTGIYADWNVDVDNSDGDDDPTTGGDNPWDFGGDMQYPALVVDFNGDGEATWQEFGNQRTFTTPPAPQNMTATQGNASIILSWNQPTDGGSPITEYHYQATSDLSWGNTWNIVPGGSDVTTLTVTDLSNGTAYSFRVRARNQAGNGQPTHHVTATPAAAPEAPPYLNAFSGDGQVKLTWARAVSPHSTIIKHQYQQRTPDEEYVDWTDVADSGHGQSNFRTHTLSDLDNGTEYTFRVRAVNGTGPGAPSDDASTTPGLPDQPSDLTWTPGDESITLSWTDPDDPSITAYQYRQDDGDWTSIAVSTQHTVVGLTNGTTYSFSVQAVNPHGDSPASDTVTATPGVPGRPANLAIAINDDTVTLSWDNPVDSSITGYQYRQSTDGEASWSPDWTDISGGDADTTTHSPPSSNFDIAHSFQVRAMTNHGKGLTSDTVRTTAALRIYLERLHGGRVCCSCETLVPMPADVLTREVTSDRAIPHLYNVGPEPVVLGGTGATLSFITGPGYADVSDIGDIGSENSFEWFVLPGPDPKAAKTRPSGPPADPRGPLQRKVRPRLLAHHRRPHPGGRRDGSGPHGLHPGQRRRRNPHQQRVSHPGRRQRHRVGIRQHGHRGQWNCAGDGKCHHHRRRHIESRV